ncbi:MAG TPA: hypothetical protein VGL22_15960 [Terracidiphilus sp.]
MSIVTILVVLLLYVPFMEQAWAIYAAICGGYTTLVIGLLWSDGKWARYIADSGRTTRELVQAHICILLLIVLWIWTCRYSKPWLPQWMFNFGAGEITLYLIFSGLGIVAIWWGEQSWLSKPAKRHLAGPVARR